MSEESARKSKLIPTSVGQCVWVDAGVISYRLCTLNYECERCSLHQALVDGPTLIRPDALPSPNRAEVEDRRVEFENFINKLPASARKCRYMLTGDVSYKLCINAFRCATCSFGQMMEDSVAADVAAGSDLPENESRTIADFRLLRGVHYHRGHTWVRIERDGNVRWGLDDFGQWLLGSIRHVRLPGNGEAVFEGVPACELRLNTGRIDILAPISGRVIARNQRLLDQPGLVNESPYTQGWLLMLKPSDLSSELISLLYGGEAGKWLELEIGRVHEKAKGDRDHWRDDLVSEIAGEFLFTGLKEAA
jgi:glycine cleavage system H lipoate-binding protein